MQTFKYSILSSLILFTASAYADSPMSLMEAGVASAYKTMTAPPLAAKPSEPPPPEPCNVSARMLQAGLRHIEGKGIGYNQGYTTLELLIRPASGGYSIFPFFDLRGHIFDDGKFASNLGFGFRARTSSRIWGLNTYYDYRGTHKYSYNQVGVGFETLGRTWDFRLNGYLPVGKHETRWYELKFDKFKGHSLFLKRKQEFAMTGVDGEIGAHLRSGRNPDLYLAAGPYYFKNKDKHALGAKGRLGAKWRDYFSLELSGSHDNLFHTIVQGEIGFYIPLGPKSKATQKGSCSNFKTMMDRMIRQPVVRDEIIVVDKRRESLVARDPATGDPYVFWFVNNQSSSSGTFESPFPLLSTALGVANPGDIIYIYPGDGTATGLTASPNPFQLLDNQQLLGAGVTQFIETQFGTVAIPPTASGLPLISSSMITAINLGNNNKISGLHIFSGLAGTAISAISPEKHNLTVTNCIIDNSVTLGSGIASNFIDGVITISNNTFYGNPGLAAPISLTMQQNSACTITNNIFFGNGNNNAFTIRLVGSAQNFNHVISNNIIYGFSEGIAIQGNNKIIATIQNNSIIGTHDLGIVILAFGQLATINVISNNIVNGKTGINCFPSATNSSISFQNNTVANMTQYGFNIGASGASSNGTMKILSNTFSNTTLDAINLTSSANTFCLRVQNNQANNGYSFVQTGGTFNFEPFLANIPNTFTPGGSINFVPQGFCGN